MSLRRRYRVKNRYEMEKRPTSTRHTKLDGSANLVSPRGFLVPLQVRRWFAIYIYYRRSCALKKQTGSLGAKSSITFKSRSPLKALKKKGQLYVSRVSVENTILFRSCVLLMGVAMYHIAWFRNKGFLVDSPVFSFVFIMSSFLLTCCGLWKYFYFSFHHSIFRINMTTESINWLNL